MSKILQVVVVILLTLVTAQNGLCDERYANDEALTGVHSVKAYFDVNVGEPEKLLACLDLIDTTFTQLQTAGLTPNFVIGIRGGASNFFTINDRYILDIDRKYREAVENWVRKGRDRGYSLEQCRIAAKLQEIDLGDFLPLIEIVANGYVSMIGYQSQGYAFVPVD